MEKKDIIKVLTECAKLYDENLANKNVLFICTNPKNKNKDSLEFFEVAFKRENFLHLTGVRVVNNKGEILKNQSDYFYKKCMAGKLGAKEFIIAGKGTTKLKLEALPMMVNIHKNAKMIGQYDELSKVALKTDKLVGGIRVCVGFKKYKQGVYIPNTLLREDIRNIKLNDTKVIVAIYVKGINEDKYENQTYLNKTFTHSIEIEKFSDI